jgi:hypothetical protein
VTADGVLYVAAGDKYVRAAASSARTVREHCPDLPIHLFAGAESIAAYFRTSPAPFSSVEAISSQHRRVKVEYMSRTPFERTLYLDSDTAVNADIRGMFAVLDRFDLALAHAHHRQQRQESLGRLDIPAAFPEYNAGVILYRKTPEVVRMLEEWWQRFRQDADTIRHDQVSLRELLWLSDLRVATLPPEYNVRYVKYHLLWSRSEAVTRIFHLKALHKGWLGWGLRGPRRILRRARRRLAG